MGRDENCEALLLVHVLHAFILSPLARQNQPSIWLGNVCVMGSFHDPKAL